MPNTFLTTGVIARAALPTLYNELVMGGLVFRDYDPDFDEAVNGYGAGQTVTINKPTTFTANEFDRATGIVVQDATEGSDTVTLDTIPDVSFAVTDEQLTTTIDRFRERLLVPAAEAIAQSVDKKLLSLRADVIAAGNTQGTDGSDPADAVATFVNVSAALNGRSVPRRNRSFVASTAFEATVLADPTFHDADKAGTTAALREAEVGRAFGFGVFGTANVDDTGDSLAFHRDAFALVSRPLANPGATVESTVESYEGLSLRVTMDYDINKKQKVCSVDFLYGAKTLDADRAEVVYGSPTNPV